MFTQFLTQPLANGLLIFYNLLWQNLGLAIIAFSIFLRLVLNPLTKPYLASVKKIRDVQPLIDKLKKKYKGDKAGFVKAQAELYKQKGINPAAGCLPSILQIVVLFALFAVFQSALGVNRPGVKPFNDLLYQPLKLAEGQALSSQFLYLDLAKPDVFRLPGVPFPLPGFLLILSAVLQFVSAKMMAPLVSAEKKIADKTKGKEDDITVAMQSSTAVTLPLVTLIVGISFPSGLALYWVVFSLFQAIQQYKISGLGGLAAYVRKK